MNTIDKWIEECEIKERNKELSRLAELPKALKMLRVAVEALSRLNGNCQCSIKERMSGHQVDCRNFEVVVALTEIENLASE